MTPGALKIITKKIIKIKKRGEKMSLIKKILKNYNCDQFFMDLW